jgi:hypothetical protein
MQQPEFTRAGGATRTARRLAFCAADFCARTTAAFDAIRLTQLGARAGLVSQLTNVEKAVVNRLYRQIHGRPSPAGLQPFTDAWYLRREERLWQASVVWRLSQRFADVELTRASRLIAIYGTYRWLVADPVLDITRVAFVPQLVAVLDWQEQTCRVCAAPYLVPEGRGGALCFGCRRFTQQRCRACGVPLPRQPLDRGRELCARCLRQQTQEAGGR